MRGRRAPRVMWPVRVVRRYRPDRNPLRRASDRAEGAIVTGLLAAFLASAPFATLMAGHRAYTASIRAVHAEQAARHRVPAILLQDAPKPAGSASATGLVVNVPARWTTPDGSPHTGQVPASGGAAAGSAVMVWTSASGKLTGPPLRHAQAASRAALDATLAPVLLGLLLLGAGIAARRVLDKRRLAAWDAAWSVTGPRWTASR